jgi:hypothetical protein
MFDIAASGNRYSSAKKVGKQANSKRMPYRKEALG